MHIDDRYGQQRSSYRSQRLAPQQAADDLDAIEFVTVNRRADEQHRPRAPATDDVHGHRQGRTRIEVGDGQMDRRALARLDARSTDIDWLVRGHCPLVRLRRFLPTR